MQRIILKKKPNTSYPEQNDIFETEQIQKPLETDVQDKQMLVQVMHVSIDAAMRVWISGQKTYMKPVKPGDLMPAYGVAKVLYSKSKKFQVGDIINGLFSWQEYMIVTEKGNFKLPQAFNPVDFLGVLGISGLTAYFGFSKIGKLKAGDTVVVSAAYGAVGQIAVQLAKNAGCRVIGLAGSDYKCKEVVNAFRADACINYKTTQNLYKELLSYCPNGIDVYFDNVGGQILDTIILLLNDFCRIVLSGNISGYNKSKNEQYGLKNYSRLIIKRGLMQGFIVSDYVKEFSQATMELQNMREENKLKFNIHNFYGIEECPKALQYLLQGKNVGKCIVNFQKPHSKI